MDVFFIHDVFVLETAQLLWNKTHNRVKTPILQYFIIFVLKDLWHRITEMFMVRDYGVEEGRRGYEGEERVGEKLQRM